MSDAPSYSAFPASKPALIMGYSGRVITYGELEARANQGAHLLRAEGFNNGDVLAVYIDNCAEFFDVACAARRSGLTIVPVSTKLTAGEVAFIVRDCGAKALVLSADTEASIKDIAAALAETPLLSVGGRLPHARPWDELRAAQPKTPIADGRAGREMLYSSGTTGVPKGIVYHGVDGMSGAASSAVRFIERVGGGPNTVYLSSAPLYHAAPFAWAMAMLTIGATTVVMEHFEPEQALRLIERYGVAITQWVPTHFVRMLKLPEDVRRGYDLSSLRLAVHAAAPCPVKVKRAMIDWWGPILLEYYGSSEQTALTIITSEEWLAHEGSVGRCMLGKLHICDDDGRALPTGEVGLVYSEGGMAFSYHGDPVKTAGARNAQGWTSVGDIGRLDEEGYLYLTDRKSFMIITGGVNVYPQEIEDLLISHPQIADAAVIGLPDEDLGEAVTAVIQLIEATQASAALAHELQYWLRQSLSPIKTPKHIVFRATLPRLPTGKMAKHILKRELAEERDQAGLRNANGPPI
jgi:long-chain acyl-CoA synthetase